MKTSSCKAKGRNLQNYVVNTLLISYPELESDDIKPAIMGESGEDIKLSPAAKKIIPYSFECKNVEKINIWSAIAQAESNCKDRTPVVIFKRNRSKIYAVIEFDKFIKTIHNIKELEHI